jgi:phosphoribosylformylglycinamidine synthase
VTADFQRTGDAILLLWPVPRAKTPDPNLTVPFTPEPMRYYPVETQAEPVPDRDPEEPESENAELSAFGSSEYAKAVLGELWGTPPPIDLEAEADLHRLLQVLAARNLLHSARDLSDGGIAVALAQAAFRNSIGATVEQEKALMVHPLFGLFAEPASTIIVTADPKHQAAIEELAEESSFFAAHIGTTGGDRLEISVYGDKFISASISELRAPWASALEAALHNEVTA